MEVRLTLADLVVTSAGEFQFALDGSGNILICGYFNGSADLDPGTGTATVSSSGQYDANAFLAKYTSAGAFSWGFGLGAASNDEGVGVATDGSNNVYVTGDICRAPALVYFAKKALASY